MSAGLDVLVRRHPELEVAAATLRALATTLPETDPPPGVPHLEAARVRLAAGVPALEGEPLLSGATLLANLRALVPALSAASGFDLPLVADTLETNLEPSDVSELAGMAQSGAWDAIVPLAQRLGLEQDMLIALLDHSARPALRGGAAAAREVIAQSRWAGGTCPACGATPLLGELRGGGTSGSAEHERVLRCGRCATAWSYPRLRCTACGESDHRRLSYLHGAGEESYRRVEICSGCGTYLKNVAVLAQMNVSELLSADLATTALDIAAVEQGFHR